MSSPNPGRRSLEAISRISPGDAHRLINDGDAVLVDTRVPRYIREAHAKGAISAPLDAIRDDPSATPLKDMGVDQSIILYCT